MKLLALIEMNGLSKFDALNSDISKQIQYTYDVIHSDEDFKDMRDFARKYNLIESGKSFIFPMALW